jgi:hypothetical protein
MLQSTKAQLVKHMSYFWQVDVIGAALLDLLVTGSTPPPESDYVDCDAENSEGYNMQPLNAPQ